MDREKRTRSSLFWEWMRVLDEMPQPPPILAVENVVGFLVAEEGGYFRSAYQAIRKRGYIAGALQIDAINFVPQSRPRSFLIAVKEGLRVREFVQEAPGPIYHTKGVVTAFRAVGDKGWVWWRLPKAPARSLTFGDLCELDCPVHSEEETQRLMGMLSERNLQKLRAAISSHRRVVGTGYKRIRREEDGQKHQRLEIRFDGVAGCLRTPNGGSSRQIVLIVSDETVKTRLMSIRETARLMGLRDTYQLLGSYNDAYRAMGDAVAVPVTRWLSEHLLAPLAMRNCTSKGRTFEVAIRD
jgi:DNA (cytosine-5)-methyltransferase 1